MLHQKTISVVSKFLKSTHLQNKPRSSHAPNLSSQYWSKRKKSLDLVMMAS